MVPPQVSSQLKVLRAQGALPDSGEVDDLDVRTCVYGRANPNLYEGRPKVGAVVDASRRALHS